MAWLATEAGVQRWSGCIAVEVDAGPVDAARGSVSLPMNGSPQNDAHSMALPQKNASASEWPALSSGAAKIAQSLLRPAMTTSAPSRSASRIGSAPITATMRSVRSSVAASQSGRPLRPRTTAPSFRRRRISSTGISE